MTVCGNKLSGVCGACQYINLCRNNEIANLPKTNIEWMREASAVELADVLNEIACESYYAGLDGKLPPRHNYKHFMEWLKEKHDDNMGRNP